MLSISEFNTLSSITPESAIKKLAAFGDFCDKEIGKVQSAASAFFQGIKDGINQFGRDMSDFFNKKSVRMVVGGLTGAAIGAGIIGAAVATAGVGLIIGAGIGAVALTALGVLAGHESGEKEARNPKLYF